MSIKFTYTQYLFIRLYTRLMTWLHVKQELIMEMRYPNVTYHLTCLLIYHGTTTHP